MSRRVISEEEYIQFLIGSPTRYTAVEGSRVHPEGVSHDSITRLLQRGESDNEDLWFEAREQIDRGTGVLVLDDSTLDKFYSAPSEVVSYHWSGKHHRVVRGINLVSMLWTDGDRHIPCDFRVFQKGKATKNELFLEMLRVAKVRGFSPSCVMFDGWYSAVENLRVIAKDYRWRFLTRLKSNRWVRFSEKEKYFPVSLLPTDKDEFIVWLREFGEIKVFRTVSSNGEVQHWATNDLTMDDMERIKLADCSWRIEEYHRGIKQCCGIEKCQHRSLVAQATHIAMALRAFLRLEVFSYKTGISWYEAKVSIVRDAVKNYIANPTIAFQSTA